jgi:hypothetical protein
MWALTTCETTQVHAKRLVGAKACTYFLVLTHFEHTHRKSGWGVVMVAGEETTAGGG